MHRELELRGPRIGKVRPPRLHFKSGLLSDLDNALPNRRDLSFLSSLMNSNPIVPWLIRTVHVRDLPDDILRHILSFAPLAHVTYYWGDDYFP